MIPIYTRYLKIYRKCAELIFLVSLLDWTEGILLIVYLKTVLCNMMEGHSLLQIVNVSLGGYYLHHNREK